MNIETINQANELMKKLDTLKRMQKDAVVGNLFLASIRKVYPRAALQETADMLKQQLQLGIEKLEGELDSL